jgi:hypothetical protein
MRYDGTEYTPLLHPSNVNWSGHGEVSVDACAFYINMYNICTRYKIVTKLNNVK